MGRSIVILVLSVGFLLLSATAGQARTCASTFGSGLSYGSPSWTVRGSGGGSKFDEAFSFTPSSDCALGHVLLAFYLEFGPNGLSVRVVEDSAGLPEGAVVESTTVIDQMTTNVGGSVITATFSGGEVLSAGTTYWVVVESEPGTASNSAVWFANDQGLTSVRGFRQSNGNWQGFAANSDGAYLVGTTVPLDPCASTFGPGLSYGSPSWTVRGSGGGSKFDEAFSFTPSVDCGLGTVDLAFYLEFGPNGLSVSVVEDNAGLPEGAVVESTTVIDQMTTDVGGSVVTGTFSGGEVLNAGTTYWVVVESEPGTASNSAVWFANDQGLTSVRGFRQSNGNWQGFAANSDGAYRVNPPPTPPIPALSPGSLMAMGAVLALLGSAPLLSRSATARRRGEDR